MENQSRAGSGRSARSASGGWQWGRTAHTQRALLDAAREVFTSRGFADASIADVVERAGSKAVADARKAGVTDPGELFAAGARAFLQGSWERRDLALLFLSGDGPPGFEVMQRQRSHEWVGQNDALL